MPSAMTNSKKQVRDGKKGFDANQPQPVSTIAIVSAAKAGSVLTLTFDQVVSLKGLPGFTTSVAGVTPVSATESVWNAAAHSSQNAPALKGTSPRR